MASTTSREERSTDAPKAAAPDADAIKKAVQKPGLPAGTDKDGKLDGSLGPKQVKRAATEAMIAMRPQPSVNEMNYVYSKLEEQDEHGVLKNKYKDVDAVIAAATGFVAEGRKAA
jgi:hypothetical protein